MATTAKFLAYLLGDDGALMEMRRNLAHLQMQCRNEARAPRRDKAEPSDLPTMAQLRNLMDILSRAQNDRAQTPRDDA